MAWDRTAGWPDGDDLYEKRRQHASDRTYVKSLVNKNDWKALGALFNFTPQFVVLGGKRFFNWTSAPGRMMNVLFGKPPAAKRHQKKPVSTPPDPTTVVPLEVALKRHVERQNRAGLIWQAQSGLCFYCAEDTKQHQRSMDHVVPRSRGGAYGQLVGSCKTCNNAKMNMTLTEFLETDYLPDERRRALGATTPPTVKYQVAKKQHEARRSLVVKV